MTTSTLIVKNSQNKLVLQCIDCDYVATSGDGLSIYNDASNYNLVVNSGEFNLNEGSLGSVHINVRNSGIFNYSQVGVIDFEDSFALKVEFNSKFYIENATGFHNLTSLSVDDTSSFEIKDIFECSSCHYTGNGLDIYNDNNTNKMSVDGGTLFIGNSNTNDIQSIDINNGALVTWGINNNDSVSNISLQGSSVMTFIHDTEFSDGDIENTGAQLNIKYYDVLVKSYVGDNLSYRSQKESNNLGLYITYNQTTNSFANFEATDGIDLSKDIVLLAGVVDYDSEYILFDATQNVEVSEDTKFIVADNLHYRAKTKTDADGNLVVYYEECTLINCDKGTGARIELDNPNMCYREENYENLVEYSNNGFNNGDFDQKLIEDIAFAIADDNKNILNNVLPISNAEKVRTMDDIINTFDAMIKSRVRDNSAFKIIDDETQGNKKVVVWGNISYLQGKNSYDCGRSQSTLSASNVSIGADYLALQKDNKTLTLGGAVLLSNLDTKGGEYTDITTQSTANTMDASSMVYDLSVYAKYEIGKSMIISNIQYLFFNNDMTRSINVPNVYNISESSSVDNSFVIAIDYYYEALNNENYNIKPYAGLSYNHYALSSYNESGSSLSYRIDSETYDEIFTKIGAIIDFKIVSKLSGKFDINASYALLGNNVSTQGGFILDSSGNTYVINDDSLNQLTLNSGFIVNYLISDNIDLGFAYNIAYNGGSSDIIHNISLVLRVKI